MINPPKERRFFLLFPALAGVLLSVTALAAPHPKPKPSPSPSPHVPMPADKSQISDALSQRLARALAEGVPQLGSIEPWQELLFNEEVVREPQRFIRDYRASRTGIDVDVDLESVKSYLRFYAPQVYKKSTPSNPPQIIIDASPGENCAPCEAKAPAIRQILKDRLMRRGFNVLMTKPIPQDALSRFAQEKKAEGTLWVSFGPAPADETDAQHADEIRYSIKAVLELQGYPKQEGMLEIFETGSFERSVARLLTDFFTEIGARTDQARSGAANASDSDSNGVSVEIKGIKSYAQYLKLKDKIHAVSESTSISIDERKVTSGKVLFIGRSDKGDSDAVAEALKRALTGTMIGAKAAEGESVESSTRGKLHLLNSSTDEHLDMEIRP